MLKRPSWVDSGPRLAAGKRMSHRDYRMSCFWRCAGVRLWRPAALAVMPAGRRMTRRTLPLPLALQSQARYVPSVKRYTFRCIRAGGLGPAVHIDACSDDDEARRRATQLFEIWPLAVKVDVSVGDRHFEVARAS